MCLLRGTKDIFVYDPDTLLFTGRAVARSVSRRSVTAKVRVQSQVIPSEICDGQSHCDMFSFQYFEFPPSVSFHQCSGFIFIYVLHVRGDQIGKAWEPSKKQCPFSNPGAFHVSCVLVIVTGNRRDGSESE